MTMTANIIPTDENEAARGIEAGMKRKPGQDENIGCAAKLGTLCHDLNQPLMAICGLSEIMAMDLSEDDPLKPTIRKIIRQVEKMSSITREVMDIACRQQ